MHDFLVTLKIGDGVAWLTLNRPDAMNSMTRALLEALRATLAAADNDPSIRVVVLTGNGSAFCTGADLNELLQPDGSIDPDELLEFVRFAGSTIECLPALSKPVIAAVNGFALAGGLELALACDFVVAAKSARLGDAHANYGLLPGGGGAARLARVVSPSVARYLAFTGDSVPAAELVPLGLVNEVVDDEQLEERTGELAARIAAKSAPGLARMKRLINDGLEQPLATALRMEHQALAVHVHSADMREGLAAFRERRKPHFTDTQPPRKDKEPDHA